MNKVKNARCEGDVIAAPESDHHIHPGNGIRERSVLMEPRGIGVSVDYISLMSVAQIQGLNTTGPVEGLILVRRWLMSRETGVEVRSGGVISLVGSSSILLRLSITGSI